MNPLNSLPPLTLIEASAGTGKTYRLINLCLELLLTQNIGIEQLLIVTFTRAATRELTWRLRLRLQEARQALLQGFSADPVLDRLVISSSEHDIATRLTTALRDLDQAPVMTIDGFCQWVLKRYPILSGQALDFEVLADQSPLIRQILEDFWRRQLYGQDPIWSQWILETDWQPATFETSAGHWSRAQRLLPPEAPARSNVETALKQSLAEFEQCWTLTRSNWLAHQTSICQAFLGLKGKSFSAHHQPSRLEAVARYFTQSQPTLPAPEDKLEYFSSRKIPPEQYTHPFFTWVDQLLTSAEIREAARAQARLFWLHSLISTLPTELQRRKSQRQEAGFTDLLQQVHRALKTPHSGPLLATAIRNQLRVALIDEFQDTDRHQYEIFQTLYPEGPLFLIGDPKQSIYGFRGADIHSYLSARQQLPTQARQSLDTNYRSRPELLMALEHLLDRPDSLAHPAIRFEPVKAGSRSGWQAPTAPLRMAWLPSGREKGFNKEFFWGQLPERIAAEIQLMLNPESGYRYEEEGKWRPLKGCDIAILVRKTRQGVAIREALLKAGIACIFHGQETIFNSDEAEALQILLEAIMVPGPMPLRRFLVGPLAGLSLADLHALNQDADTQAHWLDSLRQARQSWLKFGIAGMWSEFAAREKLYSRMLTHTGGERRMTNIRQLISLLQAQEQQASFGPRQLLDWLRQERQRGSHHQEQQLLELETEREAVQILTIHRSKGLEYPVVFCPSLWDPLTPQSRLPLLCQDAQQQWVIELGSEHYQAHQQQAHRAEFEEELRLAYVALTRARCQIWMAWCYPSLHRARSPAGHWLPATSESELEERLYQEVNASEGLWSLERLDTPLLNTCRPVPTAKAAPLPTQLPAFPVIPDALQQTSFSTLMPQAEGTFSGQQTSPESSAEGLLMSLPGGTRSGRFFHQLLEHIPATTSTEHLPEKIKPWIERHGYRVEQWLDPLCQGLPEIWKTSLPPGFCLAELPAQARLHELAFSLKINNRLTFTQLTQILTPLAALPRPEALPGFLNGVIDLVCVWEGRYYIIDYKSHALGNRWQDFDTDRLCTEVQRQGYDLQLALYQLALHRFLNRRLRDYCPEQHLGGSLCLFIRGMHPQHPGHGIWYQPARPETVQQLSVWVETQGNKT